MAYRLSRKEQAGEGIRRIAVEQIRGALAELKSKRLTPAEKVHQVRKHCKKLRALVRLARSAVGRDYRMENDWFRDTARPLSGARDSHTILKTLDRLSQQFPCQLSAGHCSTIQRRLKKPLQNRSDSDDVRGLLSAAGKRMQKALRRVDHWWLSVDGFEAVETGLQRTYQCARDAMSDAGRRPSEPAFHEWRKHVKYHWYHCRLLCGMWPEILQARRQEVHRLAELLGDDHDLAVLQNRICEQPEVFGKSGQRRRLLKLIDRQRRQIEADGMRLGRQLFAESSTAFVKRMRAYWVAWITPVRTPMSG